MSCADWSAAHTWLGFTAGMGLGLLMWFLDAASFKNYLRVKAKREGRTPVRIGNDYFYVVPSTEYVMTQAFMSCKRQPAIFHDDDDHSFKPGPEHDTDTVGRRLRPGS